MHHPNHPRQPPAPTQRTPVGTGDLIVDDFAEDALDKLDEIVSDVRERINSTREIRDPAVVAVAIEEILADARKRLSRVLSPARKVARKRIEAVTPPSPEPANGSSKELPEESNEERLCRICGDEIILYDDVWTHLDPPRDLDHQAEPPLSDGSDLKQEADHFKSAPDNAGPQVIELTPDTIRPDPAEAEGAAQFSAESVAHEVMTEPITPYGWRERLRRRPPSGWREILRRRKPNGWRSRVSRWWRRVAEPVVDTLQMILRVVADWWRYREVKVTAVPSANVMMSNGRTGISFATTDRFKSTIWVSMSRETMEELRAKLDAGS